jgi:periplasmic protein TonB
MKAKKSKRANLESLRTIFIQIGLVITLSLILVAFEWKSAAENPKEYIINTDYNDLTILPPITRPKAEVPKKVNVPRFVIKDNDFEVPDEPLDLFDPEDDGDKITIPDFVEPDEAVDDNEYLKVEIMPTFNGHKAEFFRNYVAKNVSFPSKALANGVGGKVYVSFVVDKDGTVNKVEILRGVHPVIDNAVLDVIRKSPRWEPGIQTGQYVKVKFSIVVAFQFQ